ncbi:hypothetical protein [Gemmata massiliana]|uniref:hypothetical protein n=1 Tax=Gemmata massiliana TaxID=1210884 RepID=UPI0013A6C319|nr:hypothetical protein [Gemmata massiliana]
MILPAQAPTGAEVGPTRLVQPDHHVHPAGLPQRQLVETPEPAVGQNHVTRLQRVGQLAQQGRLAGPFAVARV